MPRRSKSRGAVGKVTGARNREAGSAMAVRSKDAETLQGFVRDRAKPGVTVCADNAGAYGMMGFQHEMHLVRGVCAGRMGSNRFGRCGVVKERFIVSAACPHRVARRCGDTLRLEKACEWRGETKNALA